MDVHVVSAISFTSLQRYLREYTKSRKMAQIDLTLWAYFGKRNIRRVGARFIVFCTLIIRLLVSTWKIISRYSFSYFASRLYNNMIPFTKAEREEIFKRVNVQEHPFHIVRPSIWPIRFARTLSSLLFYFVTYIHGYAKGATAWNYNQFREVLLYAFLGVSFSWLYDVHFEGSVEGEHTKAVQGNLLFGFALFIVSEVRLFFSFFWAFGHLAVNPSVRIGEVWPPFGIQPINFIGLPLVNTVLLLASGVCVTWVHHTIVGAEKVYDFRADFKIKNPEYDKLEGVEHQAFYEEYMKNKEVEQISATAYVVDCFIIQNTDFTYSFEGEQIPFDIWSQRWAVEFLPVVLVEPYYLYVERVLNQTFLQELREFYIEYYNSSSMTIYLNLMDNKKEELTVSQRLRYFAENILVGLGGRILLGVIFTGCQRYEYVIATFDISDGVFGSTFFILTGLHGLHVCVGTMILITQLIRHFYGAVLAHSHTGLLTSTWYWHFVDIIWLVVYITVYVWSRIGT